MDRYTKSVLTVIAAALVVIAAQSFTQPSTAQTNAIQKVQICDSIGRCAKLRAIGLPSPSSLPTEWGLSVFTETAQ